MQENNFARSIKILNYDTEKCKNSKKWKSAKNKLKFQK
jgi:hypothetical protein